MQIKIDHEEFQTQQLAIQAAGLISPARLLLNGAAVAGHQGCYSVPNDAGKQVEVRLKRIFPDPIPRVTIGGQRVEPGRPLAWYEFVWSLLPALLLISGGTFGILGNLLGGVIGVAGAHLNLRIFRGEQIAILRYWASLLVTLGAYIAFAILITIIQVSTTGQ